MKKTIVFILSIIIVLGIFLLTINCKQTKTPERSEERTSEPAPEKPAFNPDEPAPVPEGTPEY